LSFVASPDRSDLTVKVQVTRSPGRSIPVGQLVMSQLNDRSAAGMAGRSVQSQAAWFVLQPWTAPLWKTVSPRSVPRQMSMRSTTLSESMS
jgi:hypothetical protein